MMRFFDSFSVMLSACVVASLFVTAVSHAEPAQDVRHTDVSNDRVLAFSSTAGTQPQGTVFFADYDIVLGQIGYAFTDRFQLGLTGLLPVYTDKIAFFDLAGKYNLYKGEHFRAAAIAALDYAHLGDYVETSYGGRLQGVAQWCFDTNCRSSVSLNGGTAISDRTTKSTPLIFSAGLILKATSVLKFLIEPTYTTSVGSDRDSTGALLFGYGIRLSGETVGFDLGFLKSTKSGDELGLVAFGYPWLALTVRAGGEKPSPTETVSPALSPAPASPEQSSAPVNVAPPAGTTITPAAPSTAPSEQPSGPTR